MKTKNLALTITTAASLAIVGCTTSSSDVASVAPKKLYVVSGQCYSGAGITGYTNVTSSRAITIWNTNNGSFNQTFTDFNVGSNVSAGTAPQSIIDRGDHLLVLTENPTTMGDRKVYKILKSDTKTFIPYANDPTAFTAVATDVIRSMSLDADGTLQFSKSFRVEKLNTLGVRISKAGANSWVAPSAATSTCFTAAPATTNFISSVQMMTPFTGTNQGKTLMLVTGATAVTNRISITARTGMTAGTVADCVGSVAAGGVSTVAHTNAANIVGPITFLGTGDSLTSSVYIPTPSPALTTGKLIVTYSASVVTALDNTLNFNHGVVMWDITETSDTVATITNPVILYNDSSVVYAASAIAYDSTTSSIYVATGPSPGLANQTTQNFGYNIEKFTLDIATPKLTRVSTNNQPFIAGTAQTKCITDMKLAD